MSFNCQQYITWRGAWFRFANHAENSSARRDVGDPSTPTTIGRLVRGVSGAGNSK